MTPLLLLTRPLAQSQAFAARLADRCKVETLIAPLSEIVPTPFAPNAFDGAKGLILTSANAVPPLAGMHELKSLPVWCVGPTTTKAAIAAGFNAQMLGANAAQLLEALIELDPQPPLVHAHGAHLIRDLAQDLSARNLLTRGVEVYSARALDWTAETRAALNAQPRSIIAPLFSPRAARRFTDQIGNSTANFTPIAISPACAQALPHALQARTIVAQTPDGDAMLSAAELALMEALSHHSQCGLRPGQAKSTKT